MNDSATIPLKPDERELQRMIRCLRPDTEVYCGRKFFQVLLEYKGVDGVLEFIERSKAALLTQTDLDLHYNFDAVEREIFNKVYVKFWSRREFLNTVGWGGPGLFAIAYGGAGLLEQAEQAHDGALLPKNWSQMRTGKKAKEAIMLAEPLSEIVIGGALLNESFENAEEIKLEQIADAIDVLGKKLRIETQLAGASR